LIGVGIERAVSADGREGKRGWPMRCRFLGDVEARTTRAGSRREIRRSRGAWRGVRDGTREIRERRRKTRASCPPTARLDRSFLGWLQSEAPRKAHGGFRREARGEGTHRLFCCCFEIRPLTEARRADGGAFPLIAAPTLRTALRT
jgi:hypothetical protein